MQNFLRLQKIFFAGLLSFFISAVCLAQNSEIPETFPGYIDTHMHLYGSPPAASTGPGPRGPGMRWGPGPRGPGMGMRQGPNAGGETKDYGPSADQMVRLMNELGVEKAVVMPPPQGPSQKGGYTYHELLSALHKYPDRLFLAAGGGELSPLITGTPAGEVTDEIKAIFRQEAQAMIQDGAVAFGEMASLHYSFSPKHIFKQVPADHPLFLLLADLAAEYDVPIDLHMEAVPEDQPTPQALRDASPNNPEITQATIPAFERLLAHNRNARIVWTHVGWDNTGHLTVALLRRLLTEHSNLYGAIKFVRQEYEHFGLGNKLWDENTGALDPEWVELIREFPDRFMVGADEFVRAPGGGGRASGPPSFEDTWKVIASLPDDLRPAVGRDNAARVYKL